MQPLEQTQRRELMTAAKLAVRAYAHDPSSANAAEVELAWQEVRRLDRVAHWRRTSTAEAVEAAD